MACPFFLPERLLAPEVHRSTDPKDGDVAWVTASLGGLFLGSCLARQDAPWVPDLERQRACCNRGYARQGCDRFPADAAGDQARFSAEPRPGGEIAIRYAIERNYYPAAHGTFVWSAEPGELRCETGGDAPDRKVLAAQARAFLESFLRHSEGAER